MTVRIAEFDDPRLVAVFDSVNGYDVGTQPEFYASLAAETGARSIVDVGCGTGVITCALARVGYQMVGIDPSAAMLAVAGRRPGADSVEWICGEVTGLGSRGADLAFMSGHVAQFFVDDDEWSAALVALRAVLRPGGTLSFESRNPHERAWLGWTRDQSVRIDDPVVGPIETWSEVHAVANGVVSYANHYLFGRSGEEWVSTARLRFRTLAELAGSLGLAGFEVERVLGDWDGRPAGPTAPEFIVVASC